MFLPVVLALYYVAPHRSRNYVITVASLLFYAVGEWAFLPWLLGSTAVSYLIAIGFDRWRGRRLATVLLVFGIVVDLAMLGAFKYAAFFTQNLNSVLASIGFEPLKVPSIALPLGISFFTFHKISYKIDVARGVAAVRRNPLDLLLYILLFPQLIAGPIVRYHDISDELVRREQRLDDFAAGVRRFIIGFGKKMLIANTVAVVATKVFAIPSNHLSGTQAWLGVICYTIQIYADFSGYSDMAIGLAQMFGFHFPENFNHPYSATSITDFWRRWHISLSRWFRDYLYIPLGGNRVSSRRTYVNLLVVFLLCGLWHGAKWNFIVWGLFHGGLQIVERLGVGAALLRLPRILRHVYTMLLVMIGWVFFEAGSLTQARAFLGAMFTLRRGHGVEETVKQMLDNGVLVALIVGIAISFPLAPAIRSWFEGVVRRNPSGELINHAGRLAAVFALLTVFVLAATEMAGASYNPFIYFRF